MNGFLSRAALPRTKFSQGIGGYAEWIAGS